MNPKKATPTDTCDSIDFEKEEVFKLTKVAAAIRGLKSGKAAAENETRPEMLKALNGKKIGWLSKNESGGNETWKNNKRLADTGVIIFM